MGGHGPAHTVWNQPGVAFERDALSRELVKHETRQVHRADRILGSTQEDHLNPRTIVARTVASVTRTVLAELIVFPVNGDERLELHLTGKPATPEHKVTYEYWNSSNNTTATCTCGWIDRWPGADGSAQQSGATHEQRSNR